MQSKFIQASIKERELMKQLFKQHNIKSFYFTDEDGYDIEDGYYTATTTSNAIVFEVKNRDITSTKYDTTIIEKEKVNNLLKKAKETENIPYIFFFFTDNKYMVVKLEQDKQYTTTPRLAPITTMGYNEMILKDFVDFDIKKLWNY